MNLRPPRCPRCDYDLSGTTDAWTTTCPLDGRCTECGLTFQWRNIFTDRLSPGFVESDRRFTIRAALRAQRRALRPWYFWRWVAIETEIRLPRAATSLLVHAALLALLTVTLNAAIATAAYLNTPRPSAISATPRWFVAQAPSPAEFIAATFDAPFYDFTWRTWLYLSIYLACLTLIIPALYLILTTTLERAKVRPAHLLRIAAYSASPALLTVAALWPVTLVRWLQWRTPPGTIPRPLSEAFETALDAALPAVFLVPFLWTALHYRFANKRYLRLPRATVIALSFTLIAAMTTVAAIAYTHEFLSR